MLCLCPLQSATMMLQLLDENTHASIAEAVVLLRGDGRRSVADASGWARLELIEGSPVTAIIRADGYELRTLSLEIPTGSTSAQQTILLKPVIIEMEAFTVQAELTDEDRDILASRQGVAPSNQISGTELQDPANDGVGDALERVAGVTVSSDEAGPGISIRGAGANQTRVTLDGQSMAGGGGRGTTRGAGAMNQIPREFIQRVQVMKAPTPDMDADAIGGSVDLQTSRVANSNQVRSSFSLRGSADERFGGWSSQVSAAHAQPFFNSGSGPKFGLLISANANMRENAGDNFQAQNRWPLRTSPETGERLPTLARLRVGTNSGSSEGYGFLLNTDLQFSKSTHFQTKLIWSRRDNENVSEAVTYDFIRGRILSLTERSGAFENMRMERQFSNNSSSSESSSIVLAGEHKIGDWLIDESIGYTSATTRASNGINATFQSASTFDGQYDRSAKRNWPEVAFSRDGQPLDAPALMDPSGYSLIRYDVSDRDAADNELSLRVNAIRKWSGRSEARWMVKTGIKSRMRDSDLDTDRERFLPANIGIALGDVSGSGSATLMEGLYPRGPVWNEGAFFDLIAARPETLLLDVDNSRLDSQASDFGVREDIHATYLMAERETERWIIIAGLRMEYTDFTADGYETIQKRNDAGGRDLTINPVSIGGHYDKWLPGLHFLHKVNQRLVLRCSLTRTLQRPDFRDLSPSMRVNLDAKRIRSGNPELQPFEASAVDIGADFVVNGWGSMSLGIFGKHINDFIVDVEEEVEYLGEPGFLRAYPVNGSPARIIGLEVAWNTSLAFISSLLEDWNLSLNYTWTDSSADYPGYPGLRTPLPEQVREVLNAGLRYSWNNWTLNLRTRYQGVQLNRLSTPGEELFNEPFWTHSVSLGYKVNDSVNFSLSFNNINQGSRISYQGNPEKFTSNRPVSRSINLGLNVRFGRGLPTGLEAGEPQQNDQDS